VAEVVGIDGCGAALLAAVGLLGVALLVIGRRLRAARERLAAANRSTEQDRREAEVRTAKAEAALLARESLAAGRRVEELAEVRAAIRAMIDRAEAARDGFCERTAA
jgi:hypothetical protein